MTVKEKHPARELTASANPYIERDYWIDGTDDEETACINLLADANCTAVYKGLYIKQVGPVREVGPSLWFATVRWEGLKYPETGDSSYSFDTGGGTEHITRSLGTTRYAAGSDVAPDYKGAIGVSGDNVEGVDIVVPTYRFTETHYIAAASVTETYKVQLADLTGTTNAAPFRGFAAGEVLFEGAAGSQRSDDDWEITYRFARNKNRSNISIGDITGIDKRGWEYVWIVFEHVEVDTPKTIVQRPKYVYVEQVYYSGDYTLMGI